MRIHFQDCPQLARSYFVLGDEDPERKIQAEVLLNAYSRDLERRRLSAGAQGLLISGYGKYPAFNDCV